ncbi:MAG: hypothetical protein DDT19_01908 [Syntrophomonadaceae bacterium]|nr:hypothetical protein [Bacillota bacterium]
MNMEYLLRYMERALRSFLRQPKVSQRYMLEQAKAHLELERKKKKLLGSMRKRMDT